MNPHRRGWLFYPVVLVPIVVFVVIVAVNVKG